MDITRVAANNNAALSGQHVPADSDPAAPLLLDSAVLVKDFDNSPASYRDMLANWRWPDE